jgi:quinol monooxygenase YgiN
MFNPGWLLDLLSWPDNGCKLRATSSYKKEAFFMRKILCALVVMAFVAGAVGLSFAGQGENNGKKITVFARIHVKPASAQKAKEFLLNVVLPQTRQEPGCINYDMHQGVGTGDPANLQPGEVSYLVETPGYFMFYENWRSREDWDKHMNMPYLQEWSKMCNGTTGRGGKAGICDGAPEVTIWEMIDSPSNAVFRGTLPGPEKYTLSALVSVKAKDDHTCSDAYLPPPYPASTKVGNCVDRAYKEMLALVPLTHLEPGCINYEMHVGLQMDDNARNYRKYLFYENWYDFHVWKVDHMKSSYLINWFNLVPIVTEPVNGAVLEGWKMISSK